ncbi:ABC transporter substrate-binding protein [Paraburkholderia domus]|jgi:ABC-type Fe3+-hydroxamate transport system, periplasmic component|uniref:ABC transporter substrate-binding protein n=1 Tax=Paraburkholderia domus TaxID=2793075 RepID=UPI001B151A29|nr:ABC transporter substrate-binding protein [Paraburkholderia domus]MBK5065683.1 ABC transporter substrate-binding protein [Burkholderia sp. R-70199]CAE6960803.1 Iron(3+)-hydroxamate-binding protein FhuD [Paraburkholderia domus]
MSISRREIVSAAAAAALLPVRLHAAAPNPRIAVLDWAIAETMIVLGVDPIALVAARDWDRFVVEPRLPAGTVDIGVQQEVNFELLAELRPDLIFTSPFSQNDEPALRRIATTERLVVFEATARPLDHPRWLAQTLGSRLGRQSQAQAFLNQANLMLAEYQRRLLRLRVPPLLLVNFLDARHVRVYAGVGLYQNVFDALGLVNAWTQPTNAWGFATVGIERLATDQNVRLIAFEPVPPDARPTLAQSPLWRDLPFVRAGRISVLPPVLMFGAMPAALRFAGLLTTELEGVAA